MKEDPRVFLPGPLLIGQRVPLPNEAEHYLTNVLRLRDGDRFLASDLSAQITFTAILSRSGNSFEAHIGSPAATTHTLTRCSHVLMPPPKGERLDWACEKLSEIGVAELRLYRAEHSVVKYEQDEAPKKLARLQRLAEAAARQSGRTTPLNISYYDSLAAALTNKLPPLYFGAFQEAAELRSLAPSTDTVSVLVGPEGGLTVAEEQFLKQSGATPITLGPLVLRVETAALVAATLPWAVWGALEQSCTPAPLPE